MEITRKIAGALLDVFSGGNWTDVDIESILKDVDFQTAKKPVPFTENTIAKILSHLKYSNEIVLARAEGKAASYDNEQKGFAAPGLESDADWQKLVKEAFESAKKLADKIQDFDAEKLDAPIVKGFSTAYKNFQGVVEHAHYHLGQMVMIKKYLETAGK